VYICDINDNRLILQRRLIIYQNILVTYMTSSLSVCSCL